MRKLIRFNGMDVTVSYSYSKAEPVTREYPGCPEEYYVNAVWCEGQLINKFIEHYNLWDDVTACLVKEIEDEQ